MRIQFISREKTKLNTDIEIEYSTFANPKAFDEYDINIISFQNEYCWENEKGRFDNVTYYNDLKSLNGFINISKKTKIIILFPQNYDFKYNFGFNYGMKKNTFLNFIKLKDIVEFVVDIISQIGLPKDINVIYTNCLTKIKNNEIRSAFSFDNKFKTITSSNTSNATTVMLSEHILLTSLDFFSDAFDLKEYLTYINLYNEKTNVPEWLEDINFNDDIRLYNELSENNKKIKDLNDKNDVIKEKINKNLQYKSILFQSGGELVNVVFDILKEILDYKDLDDFKDIKKEDFLIKKVNVTFIGEIKGINTNVKNANISQVDNHYCEYVDKLDEDGKKENVKQLLIINPMRDRPIKERDEIGEEQFRLAERNKCLIITTYELLKLYGKFLNEKISTSGIIDLFVNNIGIFDSSIVDDK